MNATERPLGGELPVETAGSELVELTILMPCLNEIRTLGSCIRKAREGLERNGIVGEVLVADNGSTDGSQALAMQLGARVVQVDRRGYGAALARGIDSAVGRHIMMADSDESYDLSNSLPFVEELRKGSDLVMGNRFLGGIEAGAMPPLHRYFGNPLLTAIGRLFFKSPCKDFYCGQRAFRKEAVQELGLQSTGMEFALEMLIRSTMAGLRVSEVPVTLRPDGRGRPPHLRSWRDGWRSLRLFLIYSPRWLFLYPSLVLMILGVGVGGWLLPGARHVAGVTLDVHTLFYCAAAIMVGFQGFFFSIFGKMLAINMGLHPRNPRLERNFEGLHIEAGLVAGILLFVIGLGASLFAVREWAGVAFGDLDPFRSMRIVIPAVLALSLGLQLIYASFYAGLLQIQLVKPTPQRRVMEEVKTTHITGRKGETRASNPGDGTTAR